MTIREHVTDFYGKPVVPFQPGEPLDAANALRIAIDYDEQQEGKKLSDLLEALLDTPGSVHIEALVIGPWDFDSSEDSSGVVAALVEAAPRLPKLAAIFLGEITFDEQEISWIQQSDIAPLLAAYPRLRELRVRGGGGLRFSSLAHTGLTRLVLEAGGLPRDVVCAVGAADLPELDHLELWLGSESYGGDAKVQDLAPILDGSRFPKLRYLGLRNAQSADSVAAAVATAPILSRLRVVDLSLGALADEGAKALLASAHVSRLERLDLHHHYISPDVQAKLAALRPVLVDLHDGKHGTEDDEYRYCAVSE
ncbi:STM4015 family protein [Pendulispora brunnea]|uniref:STM4015 family protein n=1 Tax=Pendulispora brunnea TaxID=2905690 RepID=A0ABZ2KD70_9BACT